MKKIVIHNNPKAKSLECPACHSVMKTGADANISHCPGCHSAYIRKDGLSIMAAKLFKNGRYPVEKNKITVRITVRKCPVCLYQPMKKVTLADYKDLDLYSCVKCAGVFAGKHGVKPVKTQPVDKESKVGSPLKTPITSEQYRNYHDGHLVRVEKTDDVWMSPSSGDGGGASSPVFKIKLLVYYKKPFNLGLRICSEKFLDKLKKSIGLFNQQDIIIGDNDLDKSFIFQGRNPNKIRNLVLFASVRIFLQDFIRSRPRIIYDKGDLEILDDGVVYTEGPYLDDVRFRRDIMFDKIINKMVNLVKELEKSYKEIRL
jgi:uncharacterized CHY-type Zn-finger protein